MNNKKIINYSNMDLRNVDFSNVDLRNADLRGANLDFSLYNSNTKFPRGLNPDRRGMIKVKS